MGTLDAKVYVLTLVCNQPHITAGPGVLYSPLSRLVVFVALPLFNNFFTLTHSFLLFLFTDSLLEILVMRFFLFVVSYLKNEKFQNSKSNI